MNFKEWWKSIVLGLKRRYKIQQITIDNIQKITIVFDYCSRCFTIDIKKDYIKELFEQKIDEGFTELCNLIESLYLSQIRRDL